MSDQFLSMSDEEFMKQSPALEEEFHKSFEAEEDEPEVTDEPEVAEASEEELDEDDNPDTTEPPEGEEPYAEGDEPEVTEPVTTGEVKAEAKPEENTGPTLAELQRVLAPFKANGTEVQVRSVDEAIQLMQMGANYTKKMQGLQPSLKILKTLEKQGLLDENKVNYLIDLSKGDKGAISKLLRDNQVDWSHVDEDVEYQPTQHQVSDASMQLNEVLSALENTPTYGRCMDVVGNQWDIGSRELLANQPNLIAQLNEQMQIGVFDQIQSEVQHIKMFGGLSGMSDFEAYRTVGARLYQEGKLGQKPTPVATTQVRQQDSARSDKRKAAATPSTKKSVEQEYSPLNLSDEEFIKLHKLNI